MSSSPGSLLILPDGKAGGSSSVGTSRAGGLGSKSDSRNDLFSAGAAGGWTFVLSGRNALSRASIEAMTSPGRLRIGSNGAPGAAGEDGRSSSAAMSRAGGLGLKEDSRNGLFSAGGGASVLSGRAAPSRAAANAAASSPGRLRMGSAAGASSAGADGASCSSGASGGGTRGCICDRRKDGCPRVSGSGRAALSAADASRAASPSKPGRLRSGPAGGVSLSARPTDGKVGGGGMGGGGFSPN
mmetsp:Transcript_6397/g.18763  ORF Transcript_6397/g.18763 Transcript_6397/m.18763 type:complete len:242 (-) Transcript_6397:104-829(-)